MSDSRNEFIYKEWSDSSKKFNYFISGLLGALSAYFIQNLAPFSLGANASTIQFTGLICFVLSLYSSLVCMECDVTLTRMTAEIQSRKDRIDTASSHNASIINLDTGRLFTGEELKNIINSAQNEITKANAYSAKEMKKRAIAYSLRNWLMTAGLVICMTSKIIVH